MQSLHFENQFDFPQFECCVLIPAPCLKKLKDLTPASCLEFFRGKLREREAACDMEAAGLKLEPFQQLNGLWSTLGIQGSGEMQKQLLRELLDGFFFHEQQYIPHGVLYCMKPTRTNLSLPPYPLRFILCCYPFLYLVCALQK